MSLHRLTLAIVCALSFSLPSAQAADAKLEEFLAKLKWTKGPAKGELKDIAQIQIPSGFRLTDGDGARAILEAFGNHASGSELGILMPEDHSRQWFVIFRFNDGGYVKDDDKDKLDADKLLKSFKEGNDQANEERKKNGSPMMTIIGWDVPPRYNSETKNLEWCIRGESEGQPVVNYNTKLLGRKGFMDVKLVIDPAKLTETLPAYTSLLKDFSYKDGQRYAEYRDGDKVAKYGLAALVTGVGVAAAAKLGLLGWLALTFKKLWKLIVVAVVAVGGFFKKLVFGRDRNKEEPPPNG